MSPIGAFRAIVEMLGLVLFGQGILYVLAGRARDGNAIYRLFKLITGPVCALVARGLPRGCSGPTVGMAAFVLLFGLWIGLAILRKSI